MLLTTVLVFIDNTLSHILWAVIDTETPMRWKKLTTWWPDCSQDIEAAAILRTGLKEWEQTSPELKIHCTENNQNDAGQITDFKMTVRANCAVSTWSPLPSVNKSPGLSKEGISVWTGITSLRPHPGHIHSSKLSLPPVLLLYCLLSHKQPDSTLLTLLVNTLRQNPLKDKFTAQVPAPTQLEKTAQWLHQWLYKRAIAVVNPITHPHPCLSLPSEITGSLYCTPGDTLTGCLTTDGEEENESWKSSERPVHNKTPWIVF